MLADATNKLEQKLHYFIMKLNLTMFGGKILKKREDYTYSTICISVGKRLDSSSHSNKNSILEFHMAYLNV